MAVKVKSDADKVQRSERKFTKQQFIKAKEYRGWWDLLNALLEDGKTYTVAEIEKLVQEFLEKEM